MFSIWNVFTQKWFVLLEFYLTADKIFYETLILQESSWWEKCRSIFRTLANMLHGTFLKNCQRLLHVWQFSKYFFGIHCFSKTKMQILCRPVADNAWTPTYISKKNWQSICIRRIIFDVFFFKTDDQPISGLVLNILLFLGGTPTSICHVFHPSICPSVTHHISETINHVTISFGTHV